MMKLMKSKKNEKTKLHQRIWEGIQVIAVLSVLFVLFSDLIRGRAFSIGKSQIIAVVVGLVVFSAATIGRKLHLDLWNPLSTTWGQIKSFASHWISWLDERTHLLGQSFSKRISQRAFDVIVLSLFAIFSLLYTLGRWNGVTPFVYLGSDASYISSYAKALDQPTLFANDYFLSNTSRVDSYLAVHIPLIRLLKTVVGDYGSAFLVLLPFVLFFSLFGFYWLGKKLFQKSWVALLFSIAVFPIVYVGVSDYWGITQDVLPRNLFEVAFPWILYYCIDWLDQPKKWWKLFLGLGVLTYVHSISAVVIVATVFLVFLVASKASFKVRLITLLYCSAIYAVSAIPFAYLYFGYFKSAQATTIPYAEKAALLLQYFGSDRYDFVSIFKNLVQHLWNSGILPLVVLAVLVQIFLRKTRNLQAIKAVTVFTLAICFVSIVCPLIEYPLDNRLQLLSQSMLIVRGIRFIPPLLVTFAFLVFFGKETLQPASPNIHAQACIFALCGVLMFAATWVANPQDTYVAQEFTCLGTGHLTCETQEQKDAVDILYYIDQNADIANDTFLTVDIYRVSFANAIRYQAGRAMGFNYGDQVRMLDDPSLQNQIGIPLTQWQRIEHIDPRFKLLDYYYLARTLNANYLIVQLKDFPTRALDELTPIYRNQSYMLLKAGQPPLPTFPW